MFHLRKTIGALSSPKCSCWRINVSKSKNQIVLSSLAFNSSSSLRLHSTIAKSGNYGDQTISAREMERKNTADVAGLKSPSHHYLLGGANAHSSTLSSFLSLLDTTNGSSLAMSMPKTKRLEQNYSCIFNSQYLLHHVKSQSPVTLRSPRSSYRTMSSSPSSSSSGKNKVSPKGEGENNMASTDNNLMSKSEPTSPSSPLGDGAGDSMKKRLEMVTEQVRAKMQWNVSDFLTVISVFALLTGIIVGPPIVE